jgi:hypothetical protein
LICCVCVYYYQYFLFNPSKWNCYFCTIFLSHVIHTIASSLRTCLAGWALEDVFVVIGCAMEQIFYWYSTTFQAITFTNCRERDITYYIKILPGNYSFLSAWSPPPCGMVHHLWLNKLLIKLTFSHIVNRL